MSEPQIPWDLQKKWFESVQLCVPEHIRPLVAKRLRSGEKTYGDNIFRRSLTMEGELWLHEMADEEEADWWVYKLAAATFRKYVHNHWHLFKPYLDERPDV